MKVNGLQIRNSLGSILKKLEATGEPIIVEKGRKPVAVLISIDTFERRFVDYQQEDARKAIVGGLKKSRKSSRIDSVKILRELRYGSGS